MWIMAGKAGNPTRVHQALNVVIALHSVFVRSAVREVCKAEFAELVFFQLPEVLQFETHMVANRPVVILAIYWILERPALRMALDAGVVGINVIHSRRVQNRRP